MCLGARIYFLPSFSDSRSHRMMVSLKRASRPASSRRSTAGAAIPTAEAVIVSAREIKSKLTTAAAANSIRGRSAETAATIRTTSPTTTASGKRASRSASSARRTDRGRGPGRRAVAVACARAIRSRPTTAGAGATTQARSAAIEATKRTILTVRLRCPNLSPSPPSRTFPHRR